jgi:hypothetical protein
MLNLLTVCFIFQTLGPETRQGVYQGRVIEYVESNGMAIVEGDIVLGPVSLVRPSIEGGTKTPSAAIYRPTVSPIWPPGTYGYAEIPYSPSLNLEVASAIADFNRTFDGVIKFVLNGARRSDYVVFDVQGGSGPCIGSSSIGRQGGRQAITIEGGDCKDVILHEMGHAAGLLHEHTRKDRAKYLTVNWANIPVANRGQYRPAIEGGEDAGSFDYGSIMIYTNTATSTDSQENTLDTIPRGIRLRPTKNQYSVEDVTMLRRLYKREDPQYRVVSNPPGIPLEVDGVVQNNATGYFWRAGETHALDVPRNQNRQPVYNLSGVWHLFARWNDVPDFDPSNPPPPGRPVVTRDANPVYTAHFVRLKRMTGSNWFSSVEAEPSGGGGVSVAERPIVIGGVNYRVEDVPVTVTANPAPGFAFYGWSNANLTNGIAVNPRRINLEKTTKLKVRFTRNPVTRVITDPPGLAWKADGNAYLGARNFAVDYDAAWTPGSRHSLSADPRQPSQVEDSTAILRFQSWSQNGPADDSFSPGSLETPVRANGQTITLQYVHAFRLEPAQNAARDSAPCAAARFAMDPPPVDNYYDEGSKVKIEVQPNPGWEFLGWDPPLPDNEIAISGSSARPLAIFNTNSAPLSIESLDPPRASVGTPVNLTVNGSGFDDGTRYCLHDGGTFLGCDAPAQVTPRQIRLTVAPGLLAQPRGLEIELRNSDGRGCEVASNRATLLIQ